MADFSPPSHLMPTILPFRSGYTGRRAGDAGPVRVVGRRRKGPSPGFVKTVSPRRHGRKEKRVGRKRQSLSRRPAERRVCLWGTQGEGRCGVSSPVVRPVCLRKEANTGNGDGQRPGRSFQTERPNRRIKMPNGALRGVTTTNLYEAAFSAPVERRQDIQTPSAAPAGMGDSRCEKIFVPASFFLLTEEHEENKINT
jgi:hypothetical protein